MRIGKLKSRADALAREARVERARCEAGVRKTWSIIRRRTGSPAGLAISFSLGFIIGTRPRRKANHADEEPKRRAPSQLFITLVDSATKLLFALLARTLIGGIDGAAQDEAASQALNT